jgi:putative ABC transport system substrate-binding protein
MRLRFLLWRLLSVALVLAGSVGGLRAAEPLVAIVSSERGAAYQEAAFALLGELERGGVASKDVLQITVDELAKADTLTPLLYVALGTQAASVLARSELKTPVLCTLLPQLSFERLLRESGRKASPQFSALFLNQTLERQLDLVRLALPQVRRIGVILGPESQRQTAALEGAVRSRSMTLVRAQVESHELVFEGLKNILGEADVLLALPDTYIYNSNTIQNILLTSYRARVPMLAFSPAYARAGALLSVYSTPAQIGRQAGVMARSVLQGKALDLPQYPQEFSVSVNEHVARSLGLNLDPQALTERLHRLEDRP